MNLVEIKPLSVNDAWQGKRYKTDKYKKYVKDLMLLLPRIKVPDGKLVIELHFGFSSKASDIDNPIKCFLDCLQKKYKFDDNRIYLILAKKVIVKRGSEFIKFNISKHEAE